MKSPLIKLNGVLRNVENGMLQLVKVGLLPSQNVVYHSQEPVFV